MQRGSGRTRRVLTRWAATVLLLSSAAFPAVAVAATAVPAGMARIWFYRDYEPYVSLNMAPVALNGTPVGYVPADGSALYRDVPAGRYHITVQSAGQDVRQDRYVDLAPGQEAFVKILTSQSWEDGGDLNSYHRDTFYVSLVPEQVARAQLANRPLVGG